MRFLPPDLRPSALRRARRAVCTACWGVVAVCVSASPGCGASRSLLPDDTAYFSVGVDPRAELDEATRALGRAGLPVVARVDRPRFSAAAYLASDGRSAVRVATTRGIALALDGEPLVGATMQLDARTGEDLDGDAVPDVVVARREESRTCLALASVDAQGALRPAPTDPEGIDARACLEALLDLDHDGRAEALAVVRAAELSPDAAPSIAIPLSRRDDGAFARGPWPDGFARDEIARREAAVEVAVARADAREALRLAVELGWIERERSGEAERIATAFDAVLARVTLSSDLSDRAAAARQALLAERRADGRLGSSASASASE